MDELKFYFYEILSIDFGLALLYFFGILSFVPFDMFFLTDGNTWYYALVFIFLGVFISFLCLSFYKEKSLLIMRILDLIIAVYIIVVIYFYLHFTADLMEPWMIQTAWFLRYHGILVGILLMLILIKTVAGLSSLSTKFFDKQKELKRKNSEVLTVLIISFSFGFCILELMLYRYMSFFQVLISIFVIQVCLLAMCIYLLSIGSLNLESATPLAKGLDDLERKRGIIRALNVKLHKSGIDIKGFWWLFFPLLIITLLGISILILYPFEVIVQIPFPWEGSIIMANVYAIQILSYLLLACMLFVLILTVYGCKARKRFEKYYEDSKHPRSKLTTLGALDGLKVLGIFLVISQILYFYEYAIFFPRIISLYLMFGMIGAILYFIIGNTDKRKLILYTISVLLLVINLYFTYLDGIQNSENVFDGSYEISFPFLYLHSWANLALVGISIGIILSDTFFNLMYKHTDGSDSVNRSLIPPFTLYLAGFLLIILMWAIGNPGGDPPHAPRSSSPFMIFCIFLGITLINGLIFHYITEVIVPKKLERKQRIETKPQPKKIEKKSINKERSHRKEPIRKKTAAIGITVVVIISVFGGFMIFYTFQETYQKPILAYSPGNYYIWWEKSSERISRTAEIALLSSPRVSAVEFSLAKNEYHAFQLVFRPLGDPIDNLKYEISDFEHNYLPSQIIPSRHCSLRKEKFIIENEFPDMLEPFSKMDLDKKQNYIFWFSMKTPYDAIAGKYKGELKFKFNDGDSETIEIRIKVWDFAIPKMRHLSTNIGRHTDDYDRMDNYFFHRMNDYGSEFSYTDDYTKFLEGDITCFLDKASNDWEFYWPIWDDLMQHKLDGGMNAFSVSYPLGIADDRVPYVDDKKRMTRLKNWFSDVQDHLVAKKWLNYTYTYFIDEFQLFIPEGYTREDYFDDLKILLKDIKEAAPKIKIMATAPPIEELEHLYKYIDIWCPVTYDRDKKRWNERLDAGVEMWMYACVGPAAPYPNSHLFNRLYECRILLWQVWLYNLHGFLYWASQGYFHGGNGFGFNGYGDGWFIYERNGKLYDSMRWEEYLNAMEDYEYLWLLDAALDELSGNRRKKLKDELKEIVDSIVGEKWRYCDHPSTLYNGRDRIGEILHDISDDVNLTAIGEAKWVPPYGPGR